MGCILEEDASVYPNVIAHCHFQANVFYNGCVIVEVRDYRCSVNPSSYDTSYVLLRPTCQVSEVFLTLQ